MPLVHIDGKEYEVERNSRLWSCMIEAALALPCGGKGICGKCKVYVTGTVNEPCDEEKQFLSAEELASGVRLACFTRVLGDCSVSVPQPVSVEVCASANAAQEVRNPVKFRYGAAVDIGTTTVAAALYGADGRHLSTATALNPQASLGADVLSRAQAATQGEGATLARLIRGCVSNLLRQLADIAHIETAEIDAAIVTGNTAMLCLLTETPTEHLIQAPFYTERVFGETISAAECGLQGLSPDMSVYLPCCIDAFLGADLVCAILRTGLCDCNKTALLVDVGTNGEMALWHKGQLYVCSTAAGPAFEGVGISCGMIAAEGAIDHVDIANHRLVPHIIGGCEARGVCGSGLIDAAACLLDMEEIDATGYMAEDKYILIDDVGLSREDIRALSVAKSAIRSGIDTLLYSAKVSPVDVKAFYLAGGFGNTLNTHKAARIGMIPKELAPMVECIGNAALDGAVRLLFAERADQGMKCIHKVHKVDLATNPYFADAFIRNMLFE